MHGIPGGALQRPAYIDGPPDDHREDEAEGSELNELRGAAVNRSRCARRVPRLGSHRGPAVEAPDDLYEGRMSRRPGLYLPKLFLHQLLCPLPQPAGSQQTLASHKVSDEHPPPLAPVDHPAGWDDHLSVGGGGSFGYPAAECRKARQSFHGVQDSANQVGPARSFSTAIQLAM